jgi:hypothetical protein
MLIWNKEELPHQWNESIVVPIHKKGGKLTGRCGLDSTVSGPGPVAGCCECGDEPSGSCATELLSYVLKTLCRTHANT